MHRSVTAVTVALAAAATLAATATATTTAGPRTGADTGQRAAGSAADPVDKVLVIGLDGLNLDRVADADAPHLKRLMRAGMTAPSPLYARPMAATSSGPGWSTVATGVWPDRHGVRDNSFQGKRFDTHPDFLTRIEQARPELETYAAADWEPLTSTDQNGPVFGPAVDTRLSLKGDRDGYAGEDPKIAAHAVEQLRDGDPDASYVYFGEIDIAGHRHGAASGAYREAIAHSDALVGRLLDAVDARPTRSGENWKILVATDHGHTDSGGHGGSSPAERQTFVIATGAGIPAGSVRHDVRLVDVAATALDHVGVPAAGLDGRPLDSQDGDAFDTLRPGLRTRADEGHIPADVQGWTPTAPEGWEVDNSRMGEGGTTEWHGWTFSTDAFWSRTHRDQWRELNVRSRDVFAVADSDEWDDTPHTGAFDSTLITPAWEVEGGTTRELRFTTHLRHESGQRAEVLVSFDGGTPRLLRAYDRDTVASPQALPVKVPQGAETVRFHFRYRGDNNWYWTLDAVHLA
ncbi:alkaline phosphatase family protein [Streptomyces sp. JJ38]|uniref:alkaline phosphatase family protein n=1 Tax=Streptomyces sp. JJ38 TaxID=2738128 RepID=UPI001C5770A5|nr:alkaline phosphatase family protein [Streptomyces sp. JJ38]MBW1598429.1 nucleotide pyrophosphatase [Streptomyces sp. JJ38]